MLGFSASVKARLITSALALCLFGPISSRAQVYSFCTIYQQNTVTEDVRSILEEEWNEEKSSWDLAERTVVSYDGNNPTELIIEEHDGSGSWHPIQRAQGSYDGSGRITRCTLESKQAGTFVNIQRTDFSYADGRLDVKVTQSWNADAAQNGAWVDNSRTTYSYSESQKQWVQEVWDPENEKWTNLTRVQETYDQSGRVTKRVTEVPNESGEWRNDRRERRDYSGQNIVEIFREAWDEAASAWQNDRRTQFSYPNSDLMEKVVQTWNQETDTWDNVRRTTDEQKDGDPPKTETLIETWDEDRSQWVNSDRSETDFTTYDGDQKIKRNNSQTWNTSSGEWINSNRTTYSYTRVIPVELASFNATLAGESVELRWQTASETDNARFQVQRKKGPSSTEETAWRAVGRVKGQGTTSEMTSYRYVDYSLPYEADHLTYRLKQIDTDGSASYSKAVSVERRVGSLELLGTYPNPASHRTTLRYAVPERREVAIHLYDALGRQMRTVVRGQKAGRHEKQLDISGLASGAYFLRLKVKGTVKTQRLMVIK